MQAPSRRRQATGFYRFEQNCHRFQPVHSLSPSGRIAPKING
jgi:hypothetical protein